MIEWLCPRCGQWVHTGPQHVHALLPSVPLAPLIGHPRSAVARAVIEHDIYQRQGHEPTREYIENEL
jgi:hypothetical protein